MNPGFAEHYYRLFILDENVHYNVCTMPQGSEVKRGPGGG